MSLLSPSSIAVIGASAEEQKVGHYVLKNLLSQGFTGALYPVNPKGGEILGKKAYESVTSIPGTIDLAVVVTPAKTVPGLAEECGKKGVKTLIVISAGFGELGTDEGHALEEQLVATAKKYGMTLVGPNCLGVLRPAIGMNASFAMNLEKKGSIALLSQSGALAVALMDAAADQGIDFSLVVSMGNKAAMDECDYLELCEHDPETKVIGLYLESIRNGHRFLEIAARVTRKKPIVLIKSGTSDRGRKAVSSHTGALAGSDAAIDAACEQAGVIRAKDTEEFLDALRALSHLPPLASERIAVITNAGGPGILATDAAEREKLIITGLEKTTEEALKKALPAAASAANPIDVLGDAFADRYSAAITAAVRDPNVDGIAVLLTPQVMTPAADVAKAVVVAEKTSRLIPIVTAFMGDGGVHDAEEILRSAGIPNFPTPERAMRALGLLRRRASQETMKKTPTMKVDRKRQVAAREIIGKSQGLLPEADAQRLLKLYGLPFSAGAVAHDEAEAVTLAERIGYPLVAKVSSPQILHKTDIGGVRVNLKTADEVKAAFREIINNSKKAMSEAIINGVFFQPLLPAGHEYIVGSIADASFGHLIMAGLGGIYTELLRDTVFRIAPITEDDAYAMLERLRSWKLLLGLRGKAQSDIPSLARLISGISVLVHELPEIAELDCNPVFVRPDGAMIADVKIVIQ